MRLSKLQKELLRGAECYPTGNTLKYYLAHVPPYYRQRPTIRALERRGLCVGIVLTESGRQERSRLVASERERLIKMSDEKTERHMCRWAESHSERTPQEPSESDKV